MTPLSRQLKSQTCHTQSGFTLIELMVASTVGLLLLTILGAIFSDTVRNADAVISQATLMRELREDYEMLALGGARTGVNTSDGTVTNTTPLEFNYIFGLRGRQDSPTRNGFKLPGVGSDPKAYVETDSNGNPIYRLALSPTDESPQVGASMAAGSSMTESVILLSPDTGELKITCSDTDTPLEHCTSGAQKTVHGYLIHDPWYKRQSSLISIGLRISDPSRLNNVRAFEGDYATETWFSFHPLVTQRLY